MCNRGKRLPRICIRYEKRAFDARARVVAGKKGNDRPKRGLDPGHRAIDIGSTESGIAAELSNFAAHSFVFRGSRIASMEALLQSLKCRWPDLQAEMWNLSGRKAKHVGSAFSWGEDQTLYWQGELVDRHGQRYQELLDEAYDALFTQSAAARSALLKTNDLELTHTVGKEDSRETVLTREEFLSRLERIRCELRGAGRIR